MPLPYPLCGLPWHPCCSYIRQSWYFKATKIQIFQWYRGDSMGGVFAVKYRKSYSNSPGLLILALIIFIFILFNASLAIAVDITLTWNTSAGATGYRLFHREAGQSYNYSVPDWQGPGTTGTVYGLDGSKTYHFVARAYNLYGESGDSNEATYPPGLNPTISLSTSGLTTSCSEGSNASSQNFTVQNTGGGTLSYTISDNRSWLSCTPSSGSSTGEQDSITVNYSTSGLVAGSYSGTITVTDANATNSPDDIGECNGKSSKCSPKYHSWFKLHICLE